MKIKINRHNTIYYNSYQQKTKFTKFININY